MFLKSYFTQTAKDILIRFPKTVFRFFEYLGEYNRFKKASKNREFSTKIKDIYPCLKDKLESTPFDAHYTYHPAWAARIIAKEMPVEHIDISSILHFSTIVSAFVPVKFYDYRPAHLKLENYQSDFADLNNLPFASDSITSLSCMHTIEHIGLGRYGDALDVDGDIKAIDELKRILKDNGTLLFVTPVGQPRIEFNAHRIYSYELILKYFSPLSLIEFSLITDDGRFITNANPSLATQQKYGCGCFWFKKITQGNL